MWIRTEEGVLLNCDRVAVIQYEEEHHGTVAYMENNNTLYLCHGDVTTIIQTALHRGQKILEV